MFDIDKLSVVKLAEKIRNREVTCVQVVEKFIENIEKNQDLNALIYFNKSETLKEASRLDEELNNRGTSKIGRLYGVPIIIKDNIHVRQMPCTSGCPAFREFVPKEDAECVRLLREEGAIILAKANMHELAYGSTSDNRFFGAVRNPANKLYIAGGSSGGCGAALAARFAPAALGTDTTGSVRMPSSMNGVCGLRPTLNRYSTDGVLPGSHTCDTVGPMAHFIEDLQLLDRILSKQDEPIKDIGSVISNSRVNDVEEIIRIGIPINYICSNLDEEIQEAFNRAQQRLLATTSSSKFSLVSLDLTHLERLSIQLGFKLILYESRPTLINYLHNFNTGISSLDELISSIKSQDVKHYFQQYVAEDAPNKISREEYEKLLEIRKELIKEYERIFEENRLDAIIYPTLSCKPVRFDEIQEPLTDESCCRNSLPSSLAGLPSLSIPMARSSSQGLPIGLQIDANSNKDAFLLDLAKLISSKITIDCDI